MTNTSICETPNRLMLGREVVTPLELLTPPSSDTGYCSPWMESLHDRSLWIESYVTRQFPGSQSLYTRSL